MSKIVCRNCNRSFSNFTLHVTSSRCGRMRKGTMDDKDKEMIEKYGEDRAIRRIKKK